MTASTSTACTLLIAALAALGSQASVRPTSWTSAACTDTDGSALGLLQHSGARVSGRSGHGRTTNSSRFCIPQDRSADLDKPIMQVRAEHPDANLFCYFSMHVPWFNGYDTIELTRNYVQTPLEIRATQLGFSGILAPDGTGPLVTFHMEGLPSEGLTSHIDGSNYLYDDLYCYTLGFLQNQGLDGSLVHDYDAWKALGRSWCEKAGREFDFTDQELTVRNHFDMNPVIMAASNCAAGLGPKGCTPVTRRQYILHAYQKCLLGDEAPEMTYCNARGCLLGNHIGHFGECS